MTQTPYNSLVPEGQRAGSPHRITTFYFRLISFVVLSYQMITVTDDAVRHLQSLLKEKPEATGKGLRVQIAKGGCSGLQYEMTLDGKRPDDAVTIRDGVEFLVDPESAQYLEGATLDFHDGLTGAGFHIANPNASRTCGCGSSFDVARPA